MVDGFSCAWCLVRFLVFRGLECYNPIPNVAHGSRVLLFGRKACPARLSSSVVPMSI